MNITTIVTTLIVLRVSFTVAFFAHRAKRSPWDSPWGKPVILAAAFTTITVGALYALGSSGVLGSQPIVSTNRNIELVSISHQGGQASLLYMDNSARAIRSIELHDARIQENTHHAALHYESGCRNTNSFIESFAPCSGTSKLVSVDLPQSLSDLLVGTVPEVDFPNEDAPVAQVSGEPERSESG